MPNREDEWWAGEKENLRYCAKHNWYYRPDLGCQLCFLEKRNQPQSDKKKKIVNLRRCPSCRKTSLFWNETTELYECLNLRCERQLTQEQFKKAEEKALAEETKNNKSHNGLNAWESKNLPRETEKQAAEEIRSPEYKAPVEENKTVTGKIQQPSTTEKIDASEEALPNEESNKPQDNVNAGKNSLLEETKGQTAEETRSTENEALAYESKAPISLSKQLNNRKHGKNKVSLKKCPFCHEVSLSWDESQRKYICNNTRCDQPPFTIEQLEKYEEIVSACQNVPRTSKAWFGNEYFDPKSKKWINPTNNAGVGKIVFSLIIGTTLVLSAIWFADVANRESITEILHKILALFSGIE